MGAADRHNDRTFAALWTAHGWTKLRLLWTLLRHPGARRRLRAPLWRWLCNRPTPAVNEARVDALASLVTSVAELDAMLLKVEDLQARAVLRKRLRPMVKHR